MYNSRIGQWTTMDPMAEKYYSISPYAYCANNPINVIDPDGRKVVRVHGTWSDDKTWKNRSGILYATERAFGDKHYSNFEINWSGGNYASMRTTAAKLLVRKIQTERIISNLSKDEPITLVGHSHGGNVSIEAINMMTEMEAFKGIQINLLTINTPVRPDYQLSEKAQSQVNHINIYDEKDPVQVMGGNNLIMSPIFKSSIITTGEFGISGRVFDKATNIKVDNPQGLGDDFHNSHNRITDWFIKLPKK